jgi:hypothetical protein
VTAGQRQAIREAIDAATRARLDARRDLSRLCRGCLAPLPNGIRRAHDDVAADVCDEACLREWRINARRCPICGVKIRGRR